jgi:hypothetical protein
MPRVKSAHLTRVLVATCLAVLMLAAFGTHSALAYWGGAGDHGGGNGTTGAGSVDQGATPTASETGGVNVVVRWGASSLSSGQPVDGYLVKRYDANTGAPATITGGCAGTVTDTTCAEAPTPVGDWKYTVTPVFAANWRGDESLRSGGVSIGPGSMTIARTLFGGTVAPLPSTVTGTVSGFAANAALTYTLDDASTLVGSPSLVGADGSASISLTIPSGTADGPHTISVISAGREASTGILVDTTAPTVEPFFTPTANAAGWNDSSPVEANASVDDGTGSGVAYAKYTDDGSDPKTSPTAQYATAPLSIATTTTLKLFVADLAGNESAVYEHTVKIDVLPPYFTVDFVDIHGGAYLGPVSVVTGEPGTSYYRGADSGSLRFLMTPLVLGGSPAVSAGFTELPPDAFGFSFDATTVSTPAGGPFLSSPLSWEAGTTSTPAGTISLTNAAGNTLGGPGELRNDSTPPVGGSVDATGLTGTGSRYSTTRNLGLSLAKGADPLSGLADGTGTSQAPTQLQRAVAPLTSANGVGDGTCGTYSAYIQIGADDPPATVSDTVPADDSCYRYRYLVSDNVGNVAAYVSADIKVKVTASATLTPTVATLSPVSGAAAQWVTGSTIFYNPAQSGSFSVDTSASSPFVGIARVAFPAIAGFSGGGDVDSPINGTTFSSAYAWSANGASASPGVQAVTAINNAGVTATNSNVFSVIKDDVAPTGGAVDATGLVGTGGRYSTSMTLSVGFTPGTDPGAGLASSGADLRRASAALISGGVDNGNCGTFGSSTQVGADDPLSPRADTVPVDRTCYRYTYVVSDRVGNQTTYTSPAIKVYAAPAPAPTLSFSGLSNSYWSGTGAALFYRPGAGSGGFTVTANSVDAAGYTFPTLPAGWSGSSGGSGVQSYSWASAGPTAPVGSQNVTMTTNTGANVTAAFTATPDATTPTGGSLTYTNGYTPGSSVSISFTKGTDTISGLNSASGIVEISTAPLSAGACGTFGPFTTGATNPASGVSLPIVTDTCYRYRYLISDNVGNQSTYTSASVAKADSLAPTNTISMDSPVAASFTGSTIFYKGDVAGSFRLIDAVADSGSGPASATFPAMATAGWVHNAETISTPTGGPFMSTTFSWTPNPGAPTNKPVNGTDVSGKTSTNGSVLFQSDTTAPSGGNITYINGVINVLSVAVSTNAGGDFLSGIDAATGIVRRASATLNTSTDVCGTVGAFTPITLVGGTDTNVANGFCYQYQYLVSDKVGNQVNYAPPTVVKVDTTPKVTAINSLQSDDTAGNGKLEVGDRLVLTFNESLTVGTVPATFSSATEARGATGTVKLTIPGITNGVLETSSGGYLLSNGVKTATFGGAIALANGGAATTVTLTVTTLTGDATNASSGALAFQTATTITGADGTAATGTFTTLPSFKLF